MSFDSTLYEAPPIEVSPSHIVLIQLPSNENGVPKPSHDKDSHSCSKAIIVMPNNTEKWELICRAYENCPKNFEELRQAINSYNDYSPAYGTFNCLQHYIEKNLNGDERKEFFQTLLPKIISLALSLPEEVLQPIPLLVKNNTSSISLSQKQVNTQLLVYSLAMPFYVPCQSAMSLEPIVATETTQTLTLIGNPNHLIMRHFFMESREPDGVVTFTRQSLQEVPDFSASSKPLSHLTLKVNGFIEETKNHVQVDFADRYIGGMVLTNDTVQEEIRFLLCPELIVSRLFTEVLGDKEALIVTGVEQHNEGKGYSSTFKFVASFKDETPRDRFKRRRCQLIAIDALSFTGRREDQYKQKFVLREMNKVIHALKLFEIYPQLSHARCFTYNNLRQAYAGFYPIEGTTGKLIPVATGNWGCGVFSGNAKLKSLIQLIAASEAERDVTYFTFGEDKLSSDIKSMYTFLKNKDVSIGKLTQILLSYEKEREKSPPKDVFDFIRSRLSEKGTKSCNTN